MGHTDPPYIQKWKEARERLLTQWSAGDLTNAEFTDRIARITRTRDERAATWGRHERRAAAYDYETLTHYAKIRARLRFRATRPRKDITR